MTNNQSIWYLENIDVNGIFCPKKQVGMKDNHVTKTFKKGDYIYLQNEEADKMYLVTEGQVKIGTFGENGKEITKAILTAGEVFGELILTGEERRRDFAIATENTVTCVIHKGEIKELMREHNGFSIFLMRIMGSRLLDMEQRLESLVFKDSRTRIVEFLKNLGERKGQRVGYETVVRTFMTHQEIANLTATSRQTVTTVLNELRSKNILTFNRRRLLIRDMVQLAKEGGLG